MADVSYRIKLEDLFSNKLDAAEKKAKAFESTIDRINSKLNGLGKGIDSTQGGSLNSWGVAQGVAFGNIVTIALEKAFRVGADFIKGSFEDYMKYEQSMLRIKNVSQNGAVDQTFIKTEANKYKIDLQDAIDTYGEFLTMVRGSGLSGENIRKLHDNVLLVSKVTGLKGAQLDAGIRNMGKLLEEGKLESRHLRPLTYQMSGLMPYIAAELKMKPGELSSLISKSRGLAGLNNGRGVESTILMDAMDKFANDLRTKLPESLQTTRSSFTDLKNALLESKIGFIEHIEKNKQLTSGLNSITEFIKNDFSSMLLVLSDRFSDLLTFLEKIPFGKILSGFTNLFISTFDLIRAFDQLTNNFISNGIIGAFQLMKKGLDFLNMALGQLTYKILTYADKISRIFGGKSNNAEEWINERKKEANLEQLTAALNRLSNPGYKPASPIWSPTEKSENMTQALGITTDVGAWDTRVKDALHSLDIKQNDMVWTALKDNVELLNNYLNTKGEEKNRNLKQLQMVIAEATKVGVQTGLEKDKGKNLHNSSLTTEESKVTGSRPVTININIQDMIRNMFQNAQINGAEPSEAINNIKDAVLQTLAETLNVAQGYVDMSGNH